MKRPFLSETSSLAKIIFTVFVILVSFLIFQIIGTVIAIPVFNINIFQDTTIFTNLSNPDNVKILKYFQIVQSIGLFIVPPFVIGYFININSVQYLKINNKPDIISLIIAGVTMIAAIPIINFIAEINSQISLPEFLSSIENWMKETENSAQEITDAFLNVNSIYGLLFNILMIAVLPAVGEELLFRGVIQRIFIDWTKNTHIGILIAAILFSAMHIQFYGFLPRLILGLFFGYLLVWSNTIWLPVTAHFINNAFAVIFIYLINKNIINEDIETIGATYETITYTLISLIIIFLLVFSVLKTTKGQTVSGGKKKELWHLSENRN